MIISVVAAKIWYLKDLRFLLYYLCSSCSFAVHTLYYHRLYYYKKSFLHQHIDNVKCKLVF